jgi:hypothetical protein
MAADLFGWQIDPAPADPYWWNGMSAPSPETINHLLNAGDYWKFWGLSWVLLPLGLLVAYCRWSWAVGLWLLVGFGWVYFVMTYDGGRLMRNPTLASLVGFGGEVSFSWVWLAVAFAWLLLPIIVIGWRGGRRALWTWLLVAVAVGLIGAQLTYWIGSQRYSVRYYYEAVAALALLSALPLAWLARRGLRPAVYAVLVVSLTYSLFYYSIPRVSTLYRFNMISPELYDGIQARREGDRPVLALINGDNVRWRAYGGLMAVTNPHLDSDIVAAWNFAAPGDNGVREQILAQFPDRQVIELDAQENEAWFRDEGRSEP